MMTSGLPVRLLIADDHPPMREGLAALLERQADLKVIATASNGQEALEQFRRHQPDVTLMDLRMPKMEGADAVAAIRAEFPQAQIIILTTYEWGRRYLSGVASGGTWLSAQRRALPGDVRCHPHRARRSEISDVRSRPETHGALSGGRTD